MGLIELFILALGLSMDAFAVSVCKGLNMHGKLNWRDIGLLALFFGGFQALMPLTGYLLGSRFASYIERWDHWIAFVLLAWIGGSMIRESLSTKEKEEKAEPAELRHRELLMLAIATSIDALAVGVSFSMVELTVPIYAAAALIGCTTFAISVAGVFVGNLFGARYKNRAEFVGGAILILIGLKILLEHFGVL